MLQKTTDELDKIYSEGADQKALGVFLAELKLRKTSSSQKLKQKVSSKLRRLKKKTESQPSITVSGFTELREKFKEMAQFAEQGIQVESSDEPSISQTVPVGQSSRITEPSPECLL